MTDKAGYPQAAFGGEVDTYSTSTRQAVDTIHTVTLTPQEQAARGLKRIVEEIDGAMKHGTWRDDHGVRLKDTPEWVAFYNALSMPAPAQAWRVKPLEWEDFEGWGAKAKAMLLTSYSISKWSDGRFEVAVSAPGYGTGFDGERFHPTIGAAKAAAQADYAARILAALIPASEEGGA